MELLEGGKKLSSRKMHDLPQHSFCFKVVSSFTTEHGSIKEGLMGSLCQWDTGEISDDSHCHL